MQIKKVIKKILRNFNLITKKTINSVSFKIPLLNAVGVLNILPHERWMIQLFKLLLQKEPDSVFVDVGVNVGQTLLKIKSLNRDIEYYGFEPNSVCNYYLQQLVKVNKLSSCNLFPVGLGEKADIGQFYIFEDGDISSASGTTVIDLLNQKPVYTEYISILPMDFFKDRFFTGKIISLLKIDVENGELEVLKGAMETLKQFCPFVITEILPIVNKETVEKTNLRKAEMQSLMEQIDYQFYKIMINKDDLFAGLRLTKDIVKESSNLTGFQGDWNYLIVPNSKTQLVIDCVLND